MTEQEFAVGHVFFHPGDVGDHAYLLNDGQVELLTGTGESFTRVAVFDPGDVFGEMALIEERPRVMTARAVTTVRAIVMSRDEFEHQLTHDPVRARHYLRSLFERLRSLTARLGADGESGTTTRTAQSGDHRPLNPIEVGAVSGDPAAWEVVVRPLTHKAARSLPDDGLRVTRFPLRIGRAATRSEPDPLDLNDLWLLDEKPFNISRNHCEISIEQDAIIVRDRGSHLGCILNDAPIGGRSAIRHARLHFGDNVLVLGRQMSPYQFRVTINHH
jgi:Cyclic nucleotide-binding domain/FHA domain